MRISDWSSDVCSSDRVGGDRAVGQRQAFGVAANPRETLHQATVDGAVAADRQHLGRQVADDHLPGAGFQAVEDAKGDVAGAAGGVEQLQARPRVQPIDHGGLPQAVHAARSEEHTSELQSLMRISYAVFCLKKKNKTNKIHTHTWKINTATKQQKHTHY